MTKLALAEDKRLLKEWSKTDVWPKVSEQETSISGGNGQHHYFSNFCPEVSFETFGLFAVSLSRFADDIDRDQRHKALTMSGTAHGHDWRWNWEHVREQHYTDCPLYSILHSKPIVVGVEDKEIFQVRPGAYGISVDLKRLWLRLKSWWMMRGK